MDSTTTRSTAPGTTPLPRSVMSRRMAPKTSCAAAASADIGQGQPRCTEPPRPPPDGGLRAGPSPYRALVESVQMAATGGGPLRASFRADPQAAGTQDRQGGGG